MRISRVALHVERETEQRREQQRRRETPRIRAVPRPAELDQQHERRTEDVERQATRRAASGGSGTIRIATIDSTAAANTALGFTPASTPGADQRGDRGRRPRRTTRPESAGRASPLRHSRRASATSSTTGMPPRSAIARTSSARRIGRPHQDLGNRHGRRRIAQRDRDVGRVHDDERRLARCARSRRARASGATACAATWPADRRPAPSRRV